MVHLWRLFGGLSWLFAGVIWCITIIGIPIGLQCFKLAGLSFYRLKASRV